ncbi:cyclin-dependent kinase 2-associated protein 1-like [Daphnia pulicaria]|uniref:cyclin-dependent kinase 2-associated protein 1-like n=1 Tax=Daphnia pulicaria TaxID=35523 RepID=UPI001EEC7DC7|nr:cyclin-dependent kinase 2-associated protein 1-like [Daphnia pulicaria]
MDDDVQACLDTPLSHINGGGISFVVPDPDSNSSSGALQNQQQVPQSKYAQLLAVIEDMGKDIRPTYAGSKSSAERLKRGIVHARILVRECLLETERSARQ